MARPRAAKMTPATRILAFEEISQRPPADEAVGARTNGPRTAMIDGSGYHAHECQLIHRITPLGFFSGASAPSPLARAAIPLMVPSPMVSTAELGTMIIDPFWRIPS